MTDPLKPNYLLQRGLFPRRARLHCELEFVPRERELLLLRGGFGFVLSCMDYLLRRSVARLATELLLVSEDLQRARAWPCLRAGACSDVGACTEMLQNVTTALRSWGLLL